MKIKRANRPEDPTTMWVYNPTPFVITAHFGADKVGGVDVVFHPGDAKKYYEDTDEQGQSVLVPIPNYGAKLMTAEQHCGKEGLVLVDFDDPDLDLRAVVRQALRQCELTWKAYERNLANINSQRREKNQLALETKDWVCVDATNQAWYLRPWLEIAQEHLNAIEEQRQKNEKNLLRVNRDKTGQHDEREQQYQNQILLEQQKRSKAEEALQQLREEKAAMQRMIDDLGGERQKRGSNKPAEATA